MAWSVVPSVASLCAARPRRVITRYAILLTLGVVIGVAPRSIVAATPMDATSSREARQEAARAIPWKKLSPQQRRAVQYVVRNHSIYRRLPTCVIDCDPALFTFLVEHPEVVADTWRSMGVSNLKIKRNGDQYFQAEDGLGTSGRFRYLDADWDEKAFNCVLVYADGKFEGKPFLDPISARCVLLFRSGSLVESNGRTYVTARLDSFLHIDRMGIELVAKTIQPLVRKVADQNFTETLKFVGNFSQAAERNPAGVERFCDQLTNLDEQTRSELVRICYATAERYSQARREPPGSVKLVQGKSPAEPQASHPMSE